MNSSPLGVVAILGLPGAGKTTLATGLAERYGARIVSRDEIRLAMFHPCSFTHDEKVSAFVAVVSAVETNCALGHLSIVEGMPFSRYGEYEAVAAAAAVQGRLALPILLRVDPVVASQRIAAQRSDGAPMAEDRDAALPHAVNSRFRVPPPSTIELDAGLSSLQVLNAAIDQIDRAAAES
jgi:predicted kinase